MAKIYKTAMGKTVDLDALRLANENEIAIGNMRTNARGDELGPGGRVVKTRAQIMADYHKLHTPIVEDPPTDIPQVKKPTGKLKTPIVQEVPAPSAPSGARAPRGSFASSVAQETDGSDE